MKERANFEELVFGATFLMTWSMFVVSGENRIERARARESEEEGGASDANTALLVATIHNFTFELRHTHIGDPLGVGVFSIYNVNADGGDGW